MAVKQVSSRDFRIEYLPGELDKNSTFALPYASKLVAILEGHGIKTLGPEHHGLHCDELYLAGMERGKVSKEHLVNAVGRILGFPNNSLQNKAYAFFIAEGYDALMKLSVQELEKIPERMLIFRAHRRNQGTVYAMYAQKEGAQIPNEIRVFCSSNANQNTVSESISALQDLVIQLKKRARSLKLDLKVSYKGVDEEISRQLAGVDEITDPKFNELARSIQERRGDGAFNVVIVGTPFTELVDGKHYSGSRTTIIHPCFNTTERITKHEMMHNLSVPEHTTAGKMIRSGTPEWDEYLQDSMHSNAAHGYPEDENCLMVPSLPRSDNLCGKCWDRFYYYWKGVEDALPEE